MMGIAVFPAAIAPPGKLHGVEADAQIFDDVGEKGLGMDFQFGYIDQNTSGIGLPVLGICRDLRP